MNATTLIRHLSLIAALASLPLAASAHRAWILPGATVLSSDDPWVTFDAAISNDIFYSDYHPFSADGLQAIGPEGNPVTLQNLHTGKYRTTFDLNLSERGTYKIFTARHSLTARWETADGERRFYPPRGQQSTPEGFAREVPDQARNLEVAQSSRRVETFVTAGVPTDAVLTPSRRGLELVPETHPNDLFAGESARFRFLIDGQPAAGVNVSVLPDGMRYRDSQQEIRLSSGEDGVVEIAWPQAGRYFLEADYRDDQAEAPATVRSGSYSATFEVLPL